MAKKIGKLATRYARALLRVVQEEASSNSAQIRDYAEKLTAFAKLWELRPEMPRFLLSPMFPLEERRVALAELAKLAQLQPTLVRFLEVLLQRDRLSAVVEIAQVFHAEADSAAGIVHVTVTTAAALSPEDENAIRSRAAKLVSGTPVFSWLVDDSILGGLIVEFNGKVIDASLRRQVEKIEGQLLGQL